MPRKLHTRQIRYLNVEGERNRAPRPKTFRSEAQAKTWAEAQGISKYIIEKINFGLSPKFRLKY